MKLYFHYCSAGFSNCYLLGTDTPTDTPSETQAGENSSANEAIIIDPGNMDAGILNLIEENNYSLLGVLITHDHDHHVRGLKTIMRIYDTKIYAVNPVAGGHRTTLVKDGQVLNIGPFKTEVFSIPGHSPDSAVFKIDRFLFTGDTMSAGFTGSTSNSYSAVTQINALRKKILSLPGDFSVFPGHGPPSSLEVERRFNMDINSFDQRKNRRATFRFEF